MFLTVFLFVAGLGILILGAEILVRGASSAARKLGVSSLVVGLTVVSFGTSMPELIVNMFSAWRGSADIAVGNIIGSNISNILLILGLCAVIVPLKVKKGTVWKEIPLALLAMVLVYVMGNDGLFDRVGYNAVTRTDGLVLMAFFFIFLYYTFGIAKAEGEEIKVKKYGWFWSGAMILGGLVLLFWGGKILVDSAVVMARLAGMSEALIGLTIVAVGTSLPELATSLVAAIHKQYDMAVGNIVGSNIFNVFWILGLTGTILQLPFNPAASFDVLVGVAATVLLFLFMFVHTRHTLNRWQGAAFLFSYFAYVGFLIFRG